MHRRVQMIQPTAGRPGLSAGGARGSVPAPSPMPDSYVCSGILACYTRQPAAPDARTGPSAVHLASRIRVSLSERNTVSLRPNACFWRNTELAIIRLALIKLAARVTRTKVALSSCHFHGDNLTLLAVASPSCPPDPPEPVPAIPSSHNRVFRATSERGPSRSKTTRNEAPVNDPASNGGMTQLHRKVASPRVGAQEDGSGVPHKRSC